VRIGIDIQFLRWTSTGIQYYLWNLIDGLCRLPHSHQVTLFLYGRPGDDEPDRLRRLEEAFPRADVQYFWEGPSRLVSGRLAGRLLNLPWPLRPLVRRALPLWDRVALANPFRSAHGGSPDGPAPMVDVFHHPYLLLFPLEDRANVMTVPDLIPRRFPQYCTKGTVTHAEEAFAYARHMDAVLTYSEHAKQEVVESLAVAEDRVSVTPLAAHEQFRPLADREQLQLVLKKYNLDRRPYLIHIGTLQPRKNLGRLVEAFGQVKQQEPGLEHRLVLVGMRGWQDESVFETVRRLRLESDVTWLDYVPFEHLPALLNGADLFVFPSLYEGFGLPPLEAMACGTPVVSSNASSLPEVVGDAGILVDPYQTEAIAEAVRRVLTDRGLREGLREKGLARAREFSWEQTARLTLAAYEKAWERAGSDRRPPGTRGRANTKFHRDVRASLIYQSACRAVGST
jgi:glycosyltransferase involved in cell wall biosynthesis